MKINNKKLYNLKHYNKRLNLKDSLNFNSEIREEIEKNLLLEEFESLDKDNKRFLLLPNLITDFKFKFNI